MAILTVNGGAIPSPSELTVQLFEVGGPASRSASGHLVADSVGVKRKLILRWATMQPGQLGPLLGQIGKFFDATYADPATMATRTGTFRAEEADVGLLQMRNGQPVWTGVTMTWIER